MLTQWISAEEAGMMPAHLIDAACLVLNPSKKFEELRHIIHSAAIACMRSCHDACNRLCGDSCIAVCSAARKAACTNPFFGHDLVFYSLRRTGSDEHEIALILELIHSTGLPLNRTDTLGQTALFYAARDGRVECMQVLMGSGPGFCVPTMLDNVRQSAAFYAAREGRVASLEALLAKVTSSPVEASSLDHQVDPNDHHDNTIQPSSSAVRQLFCQPDKHGQTPIFYACSNARVKAVAWLLRAGVSPLPRDSFRKRARNYLPQEKKDLAEALAAYEASLISGTVNEAALKAIDAMDETGSTVRVNGPARPPQGKHLRSAKAEPPAWVAVARELLRSALFNCPQAHCLSARNAELAVIKKRLDIGWYVSFGDLHAAVLAVIDSIGTADGLVTKEFYLQLVHCSGLAKTL